MLFAVNAAFGTETEPPNVLMIAVDDLNDWIGCLAGHPQSVTPNIDRLAGRGVLFTNAHCAAPACNPSRVALMTGIRPSSSGVYHNSHAWRPLLPDAVTLPQHFMAHGYTALGAGKIFHGGYPDPPSWDEYFPSKTRTKPDDPMPATRPINGIPRAAHFDWGPLDVETSAMGDAQVVEWVRQQLQHRHDKPFFLACGIFRPHLPWYAPRKYFDRFPADAVRLPHVVENDLQDIPSAGRHFVRDTDHTRVLQHKQWERAVQGYLACIAFADEQVGRVIEALEAGPYAENTIVVLWSDHGWHLGEKRHWRKFALWERATRVPLMIVLPGDTVNGRRCDRPVNLIDVFPTLAELCGLPPRAECEGASLVPLLTDPAARWERPSLTTHGQNNHALRSDCYRYIRYADGSEELYDHRTDPNEWHNLATDLQFVQVKEELSRWLPETNRTSE
jgi:arylsulfatase A-like enzyme